MTHLYTPEGTKLLGNKVLKCIGDALGMKCEIKDGKVAVTNEFVGL